MCANETKKTIIPNSDRGRKFTPIKNQRKNTIFPKHVYGKAPVVSSSPPLSQSQNPKTVDFGYSWILEDHNCKPF